MVFAYAGHDVALIDLKERPADQFASLATEANNEVATTLGTLARLDSAPPIRYRESPPACASCRWPEAAAVLPAATFIFEGVPEVLEQSARHFRARVASCQTQPIIASTTSTILVDPDLARGDRASRALSQCALAQSTLHDAAGRAVGPARRRAPTWSRRCVVCSEGIGKITVLLCGDAGLHRARIQALRHERGRAHGRGRAASAEEIDKAVKYGFGLRFRRARPAEFIDWGGGDILYHASRYLTQAFGNERYATRRRSSSATCMKGTSA